MRLGLGSGGYMGIQVPSGPAKSTVHPSIPEDAQIGPKSVPSTAHVGGGCEGDDIGPVQRDVADRYKTSSDELCNKRTLFLPHLHDHPKKSFEDNLSEQGQQWFMLDLRSMQSSLI